MEGESKGKAKPCRRADYSIPDAANQLTVAGIVSILKVELALVAR